LCSVKAVLRYTTDKEMRKNVMKKENVNATNK